MNAVKSNSIAEAKAIEIFGKERMKMKIRLNDTNWPGLTNVTKDNGNFYAYDSVAGRGVSVSHMMTDSQKKKYAP